MLHKHTGTYLYVYIEENKTPVLGTVSGRKL